MRKNCSAIVANMLILLVLVFGMSEFAAGGVFIPELTAPDLGDSDCTSRPTKVSLQDVEAQQTLVFRRELPIPVVWVKSAAVSLPVIKFTSKNCRLEEKYLGIPPPISIPAS